MNAMLFIGWYIRSRWYIRLDPILVNVVFIKMETNYSYNVTDDELEIITFNKY